MYFNENLKAKRKEKGMKQSELANILGLSIQTISGYETGYAQPQIDTLIAIANLFQCSIDELLGREDYATGNVVVQGTSLTQFETTLLAIVNALSRDDQFQVLGFAKSLAN